VRQTIIAANWKMNLGRPGEAVDFVRRTRRALGEVEGVEVVLCPPFTALAAVEEALRGTRLRLGAQNIHSQAKGAFTGDVSAPMLSGLCAYAIVGHSERRASGATDETDAAIHQKVEAAFAHTLVPILCVGEDLAQNEAGRTAEIVGAQVGAALGGLAPDLVERCVIAYEPIWAIGTGRAATPADANRTVALAIRGALADMGGQAIAERVPVLYGGSVTVENIAAFMAMPDLDGALVGGASLKEDFPDLVRLAAEAKRL
jgi:triosephosphate isomerase